MSFNVSEFNSKVSEYGGFAKSNLFLVRLTSIPNVLQEQITANDLSFFCRTVELPSLTLRTQDYANQGFGMVERRPSGIDFPVVPTVFMLDSEHKVMRFFHARMQSIVNYDLDSGIRSEVGGRLPFEIAYKNDYVAQMEIVFFSPNYPDRYYTYKLSNVHPIEVGSVSLAWESNDDIASLPVSFSYDSIKLDGSRSGTVTGPINRGPGFYQFLYSIGAYGSVLQGVRLPRSIQDAINQYTTINTIFSSIF